MEEEEEEQKDEEEEEEAEEEKVEEEDEEEKEEIEKAPKKGKALSRFLYFPLGASASPSSTTPTNLPLIHFRVLFPFFVVSSLLFPFFFACSSLNHVLIDYRIFIFLHFLFRLFFLKSRSYRLLKSSFQHIFMFRSALFR